MKVRLWAVVPDVFCDLGYCSGTLLGRECVPDYLELAERFTYLFLAYEQTGYGVDFGDYFALTCLVLEDRVLELYRLDLRQHSLSNSRG